MSDWIEWDGGVFPRPHETMVMVRLRDGLKVGPLPAGSFHWGVQNASSDIIAYLAVEEKKPSDGNTDANGQGKQTNPKDLVGSRRVPLSVLPFRVLWRVALAMLEGMVKYGRHNYRYAGVRASVYFDALQRHMGDWWEGTDVDPDSQLHHVDKAIASLVVMRDSMLAGNFVDDRPPSAPEDFAELNAHAARIIDLHKDKAPRHFTIADTGGTKR